MCEMFLEVNVLAQEMLLTGRFMKSLV